ncbi:GNAT family N-acetyltransferase [Nocardia amamiensis]|uniref:GNAT family N-acetyltransferase n=1 Tax=Nocardia amamiensis TaxID=404578 RepID=A0ABS0D282_9NOCA|nr:GNAT family N-acetyltransferase [Nocardia amamiensis]MBF6302952.1 GNAT family N-acetyltransferase [Nocardia amamiensis]
MKNKPIPLLKQIQTALTNMLTRGAKADAESVKGLSAAVKQTKIKIEEEADIRAADMITKTTGPGAARPTLPAGAPSRSAIADIPNRLPSEYLDTRLDEIGPATVGPVHTTDGPGIARAQVLASRVAYHDLPGAAEHVDNFLLGDLGPRKIADWSRLATSGEPGLLVARTADNTVAGFIWVSTRDDGAGVVNAWYVHPNWHGTGVGRDLMQAALNRLGNVDVYTQTTVGTTAIERYQKYGFEIFGELADTPPRLRDAGLYAPQVALKRTSGAADQ